VVVDPDIVVHYELGLEEGRLQRGGRPRLEFVRTLELLDRLLPTPRPCRILDVGGGSAIYAVPLSERGHVVRLIDPIEHQVARARERAAEGGHHRLTAEVGDARALDEGDDAYDAVLLFGPLYHLVERADRVRALTEAVRVARPGGMVFGVGISRYASLIDGMKRRWLDDPTYRAIVDRDLRDGQHRNPDPPGAPQWFTTAFFHLPDELEQEAADAGLEELQLLSIEGPAWLVEDPDDFENQLFAARATESEPALMAATSHFMVAGRTPS
jgi:SAM-dependent methyltransferase